MFYGASLAEKSIAAQSTWFLLDKPKSFFWDLIGQKMHCCTEHKVPIGQAQVVFLGPHWPKYALFSGLNTCIVFSIFRMLRKLVFLTKKLYFQRRTIKYSSFFSLNEMKTAFTTYCDTSS